MRLDEVPISYRGMSGIYCITSKGDKKKYIGSSKCLYSRFKNHWNQLSKNKHCNKILQNSFNVGKVFSVRVIEECNCDKLIEREQHYIDNLSPEYNILKIAGSCLGVKRSEATRNKISKSLLGHPGANFGGSISEECKKKISLATTGKTRALSTRNRISNVMKKYWKENPNRNRKVDEVKLLALHKDGLKSSEIARELGVHRTSITIWKHKLGIL